MQALMQALTNSLTIKWIVKFHKILKDEVDVVLSEPDLERFAALRQPRLEISITVLLLRVEYSEVGHIERHAI